MFRTLSPPSSCKSQFDGFYIHVTDPWINMNVYMYTFIKANQYCASTGPMLAFLKHIDIIHWLKTKAHRSAGYIFSCQSSRNILMSKWLLVIRYNQEASIHGMLISLVSLYCTKNRVSCVQLIADQNNEYTCPSQTQQICCIIQLHGFMSTYISNSTSWTC